MNPSLPLATAENAKFGQHRHLPTRTLFPLLMAWNAVVIVACLLAAYNISAMENFLNLGTPVEVFAVLVVFSPSLLAANTFFDLLTHANRNAEQHRRTRSLLMLLYYMGAVLSGLFLIHSWGIFFGFEVLVDAIMANAWLLWGFVLAWVLVWLSGRAWLRLNEQGKLALQRLGLAVGGLALLFLLIQANFLAGIVAILSTYTRLEIIIGFTIFFAGPLLLSLYLSFTDNTVGRVPNFIAFTNYTDILSFELKTQTLEEQPQRALSFGFTVLASWEVGETRTVLGAKDSQFWGAFRNTLVFCLLLIPMAIIPALALSLVLNSKIPGVRFFRALYFLPSVAAVVGTALIWRWLYDPAIGFFNYFITNVVTFLNGLGLQVADPEVLWLSDPNVVLFSVVFLAAWQVVGYNTVLFLAGLQGIPGELYEAAQIDGANKWNQFWNVTLPLLAPTTLFVTITTIITGLQVFNEPYALLPSRPLPVQATTTVFYLYEQGFKEFQFGYASAVAWVLFVVIFGITLIQFRVQRNSAYS